jgi:hypothetical protein
MLKVIGESFEVDGSRKFKRLRKVSREYGRYMENLRREKGFNVIMVTLTYKSKEYEDYGHIRRYLSSLRVWCKRHNQVLIYFWVRELQGRGVLHYHIVIASNGKIPMPDKSFWHWGMSRVEKVRKNAYRYVAKYVSKIDVDVEIEGRLYGCSRVEELRWVFRPFWLFSSYGFEAGKFRRIDLGRGVWWGIDLEGGGMLCYRCVGSYSNGKVYVLGILGCLVLDGRKIFMEVKGYED